MIDVDIFHLNKVDEIQRKFIDGEIDRQELDNELKQENERYSRVLEAENVRIMANLSMNDLHNEIKDKILRGYKK